MRLCTSTSAGELRRRDVALPVFRVSGATWHHPSGLGRHHPNAPEGCNPTRSATHRPPAQGEKAGVRCVLLMACIAVSPLGSFLPLPVSASGFSPPSKFL